MPRLEQITADELRSHLDGVEGGRPTLRLVVGINYKEGVTQSTIADWYGISRTTVHNWLKRLERLNNEPVQTVLYDAERPGRPPKLTDDEWDELVSILEAPPQNASGWTPERVQRLIRDEYAVEYSRRHVRDLMQQAGVT